MAAKCRSSSAISVGPALRDETFESVGETI